MKGNIKINVASDHAGYELKSKLLPWMTEMGFAITDQGTYSEASTDYPDYAHLVATEVEKGTFDFGLLICGTGIGMDMTANKHQGIRSALCWNTEVASLAKSHNNANILCLPGRFIDLETAKGIIQTFFETEFQGGRHQRRIDKISC
jgi:ribose 5-phosphate isomerase B